MESEFDTEFSYEVALDYEPGITRRDPSPVIKVDELYYVWYTKATVDSSGYYGTIWYATSPDGHEWTERGEAISTGADDAWDGNGVFTPTTLVAEGKYYLFYTAVPKPFDNDNGGPNGTPTAIGVAMADSPDGPWVKFDGNPILRPGTGDDVDSHRVDDACLIVRNGQYWLYYKGRRKGLSPAETKMCLAISDSPTGPYVKSKLNPIIPSGHEVCVWPHREGVAAMISPCGPEANTIQYSPDGLHFTRRARVVPPSAPGPYRADNYREGWGPGITWGLCHDVRSADRPFLLRFECDLRPRI
jgi:predicted GH43/DUF377 family glycosyl hydrolase